MASSCTHCKCSLLSLCAKLLVLDMVLLHIILFCCNDLQLYIDNLWNTSLKFCSMYRAAQIELYISNRISRLVGFPPFWHRKQLVMLRSIMDGKYEFVSPEWDDISEQAKDLVSECLCSEYFSTPWYCPHLPGPNW